jgi:hypothetical protein
MLAKRYAFSRCLPNQKRVNMLIWMGTQNQNMRVYKKCDKQVHIESDLETR